MNQFVGKKVAVLGLGMEGIDACRFLLKQKAKVTVYDQKEANELGNDYDNFLAEGVNFQLGKDYLKKGLIGFDYIFRSPGFKRSLPKIIEAEKTGTIISSATKLFFDLCPAKIIGVTGTKGKGTTATLIYQILKKDGKDVYLAGNIGSPMLELIPKLKKSSWVVLELSSFQLLDMNKSPHLAVVLFISSEHLDYHQDTKEYIQAKSNLVRYQKRDDFCVLNADNETACSFARLAKSQVYYFSRLKQVSGAYVKDGKIFVFDKLIGKVKDLKIPGAHNWENICAAVTAGHLIGAKLDSIKRAVFSFKGLEHRLELVREIKGVKYYNDSFSTTPETTIAAIQSFDRPIILIAGGSDKGSDYTELGRVISHSRVKTLILIGQMAQKIKQACVKNGFKGDIEFGFKNFKQVIDFASEKADKGDLVILSPACASFDMFKNYKQRGRQFKAYVQKLCD